jgi:uncharacterized cupin superfamily protein
MTRTKSRPSIIVHWREVESKSRAKADGEEFGFNAPVGARSGLSRLLVSHLRLPPGARSNIPNAARDEEQFWFVLEGTPDLFVDGNLHRLKEGEGVTLNARTGISTALLNNTKKDVRLFFMSEGPRYATQYVHGLPGDARANEGLKQLGKLWEDAPKRKLGPHDGLTDVARGAKLRAAKAKRPSFVAHWRDRLDPKALGYKGSNEPQGLSARYGKPANFSRIGVHVELLKPGRRTSYPHSERDEEEFVFVAGGKIDCWLDGHITAMGEGDFVGWRGENGITHVIINNSDEDALLVVGGEASRSRSRVWYPYHPHRQMEIGDNYWEGHPVPKLGPHDGLPNALRAKLPKSALKNPTSANKAAIWVGKRKKKAKKRKKG